MCKKKVQSREGVERGVNKQVELQVLLCWVVREQRKNRKQKNKKGVEGLKTKEKKKKRETKDFQGVMNKQILPLFTFLLIILNRKE